MMSGSELQIASGTWKFGQKLSVKYRRQVDSEAGFTYERHEVYEATRVDQPCKEPDIIKIKKQTQHWSNCSYSKVSDGVDSEIINLVRLKNCPSTPNLLGYHVAKQGSEDELPNGYIAYILMQKVPGKRLDDFDKLTKAEQNRIRVAFIEALWFVNGIPCRRGWGRILVRTLLTALRDLRYCHFTHWDPRRENIIWKPESGRWYAASLTYLHSLLTCCSFIVDLEDAEYHENRTKDDVCLDAFEHLEYWGLIEGQHDNTLFFDKGELLEDLKVRLQKLISH